MTGICIYILCLLLVGGKSRLDWIMYDYCIIIPHMSRNIQNRHFVSILRFVAWRIACSLHSSFSPSIRWSSIPQKSTYSLHIKWIRRSHEILQLFDAVKCTSQFCCCCCCYIDVKKLEYIWNCCCFQIISLNL